VPESVRNNKAFSVERRGLEPDEFIYLHHALLAWNLARKQTDPRVRKWILQKAGDYYRVWESCDANPSEERYTLVGRLPHLARYMIKDYDEVLTENMDPRLKKAVENATNTLKEIEDRED
jgi:hypothetical protein